MTAPLLALALLGLLHGPIDATLNVNVKDGDAVTGEKTFVVRVDSPQVVNQVEFYVGNDIRDTQTSTPYEFKFDSLTEKDGPLQISFIAYTSTGEKAKKSLTIKIDNQIDKGAAFHDQKGMDYLAVSKWDEAITEGRIAMKADAKDVQAKVILARGNFGKGVLDQAQRYAEDVVKADPTNPEALDLLAGIDLKRAFNTFNHGTDRAATIGTIRDAMKAAVESRRKTLDLQLEKSSPGGDNLLRFSDLAIRALRYSVAVNALQPEFKKDQRRVDIANRLAYALLRQGRISDASQTLADLKKSGTLDAYSQALLALVSSESGADSASDDALREAILSDSENPGVLTAQAYLALKKGRTNTLAKLAAELAKNEGQRSEVNTYIMALDFRLKNYESGRQSFEAAVLTEPVNYDAYVERGNESLAIAQTAKLDAKEVSFQYDFAKVMFDTALIAKPDSHEALTGLTLVSLFQKNAAAAVRFGQAAIAAAPKYAASHYALSAAYSAAGNSNGAQRENELAGRLDKMNLEGRELPEKTAAWRYFFTGGRTPLLSPPQ